MRKPLGGILPAVVTPFDEAGTFRPDAFSRLLGRLYEAGIDGIYVCGSTGEGPMQSAEQRRSVAAAAIEQSPAAAQVIVHVGARTTAEAVDLARHAGRTGATAVSSLPPLGSYSFPEIRGYYARIADAAEVPLLLYYFPDAGGARLDLPQLLELCAIPGVAGIKLTDFDLFRLWSLKRAGAVVFNGRDEILAAGLLMGADGGIGTFYNLLPERVVRLHAAARGGDWECARREQDRLDELVQLLAPFPLFPAVKQILQWRGLDCGACLEPRRPLTGEEAETLRGRLREAEFEAELLGEGPDA